jgi:hypothetical protein
MELLEIFEDFQIIVEGASQFGRYKYPMTIKPRPNRPTLTLKDLEDYVSEMRERYPERPFYLRRTYTSGAYYYVITQSTFKDGKRVKGRISIYFDLGTQKFYVPASYIKKNRKLASYLIMRTLGKLGVSQTKSARRIHATEDQTSKGVC